MIYSIGEVVDGEFTGNFLLANDVLTGKEVFDANPFLAFHTKKAAKLWHKTCKRPDYEVIFYNRDEDFWVEV